MVGKLITPSVDFQIYSSKRRKYVLIFVPTRNAGLQSLEAHFTSGRFRTWHLPLLDSSRKEVPLSTITWFVPLSSTTFPFAGD